MIKDAKVDKKTAKRLAPTLFLVGLVLMLAEFAIYERKMIYGGDWFLIGVVQAMGFAGAISLMVATVIAIVYLTSKEVKP
jgi:hypothetical protein